MKNPLKSPLKSPSPRQKTGILLANLGTPESSSRQHVRQFLAEFLWDARVIKVWRPLWWLILNGVILTTRPQKSAKAYAKIWTQQGSPLLAISRQQAAQLQQALTQTSRDTPLALGMRYGRPSIASAMQALAARGVNHLIVLSLYPQFSYTTVASVEDEVARVIGREYLSAGAGGKRILSFPRSRVGMPTKPSLASTGFGWQRDAQITSYEMVNDYHDRVDYIAALAHSIRCFQAQHGKPELLVMSFHGIPQAYVDDGDPYRAQCETTAQLLADKLGLSAHEWMLTFQSRLGRQAWLQPYTDQTLAKLGAQGVAHLQVVCPGFSVDCLETLEEVAMENQQIFVQAGGGLYEYIPCLNASLEHIAMMKSIIEERLF